MLDVSKFEIWDHKNQVLNYSRYFLCMFHHGVVVHQPLITWITLTYESGRNHDEERRRRWISARECSEKNVFAFRVLKVVYI